MQHILDVIEKIQRKKASVGLIGVGYVGEAIGRAAAEQGYDVRGYARTSKSIEHINSKQIERFSASTDISYIKNCDVICVCVPTPVTEEKLPDLSPLREALGKVARFLKKGQLVVIESSIAPGTTRGVALPILEKSGLLVERDFFLAFSPERIDPGNSEFRFSDIPKVVAGVGDRSALLAYAFYSHIVVSAHLVSSVEVAEMSKILENTFRLVNISLINELSAYTRDIGIDIHEVLHAASTKPFGFVPHYPGPGIGGHCIPVDPYYLLQDARGRGIELGLIDRAGKVNSKQPEKVVSEALSVISKTNGKRKKHRVLLVGVSYKANISDTRESAATSIWNLLEKRGVAVSYYDPHVPDFQGSYSMDPDEDVMSRYDLIIIVTDHSQIDYSRLASFDVPILDTRGVYFDNSYPHVYDFFSKTDAFEKRSRGDTNLQKLYFTKSEV